MDNLSTNQLEHSHRSWFPFILIGLTLLLLAVLVVAINSRESRLAAGPVVVAEPAPTSAEYEAGVQAILSGFNENADAQAAYQALIATTVPNTDYQAAHLALVIAFAELNSGQQAVGQARLAAALATYSWLTTVNP